MAERETSEFYKKICGYKAPPMEGRRLMSDIYSLENFHRRIDECRDQGVIKVHYIPFEIIRELENEGFRVERICKLSAVKVKPESNFLHLIEKTRFFIHWHVVQTDTLSIKPATYMIFESLKESSHN